MNWMVTWVVVTMFMVSCPELKQVPDEFGVTQPSNHYNTMACWDTEKQPMMRRFATRQEAESFIEQGKKKYQNKMYSLQEAWATDWELLEVKP